MIGSLEIAQARVLADRADRSAHTALDVGVPQDETEPSVAGDASREEELS